MLAVQPGRGGGAEEELRSVGVRAGVGHRQNAGLGVPEDEVLVLELGAVDGFSPRAVVVGEVAALAHEVADDPVERAARVAKALLAGAELHEVRHGLGHDVRSQLHLDASGGPVADLRSGFFVRPSSILIISARRRRTNLDVEEDSGVAAHSCRDLICDH